MPAPRMKTPPKGMRAPREKAKKGTLKRLMSMLFKNNKALLFSIIICIIITGVTGVASSIFLNAVLNNIEVGITKGLDAVWGPLVKIFIAMGCVYASNVIASFIYNQLMAVLTQKFLHQTRTSLFNKMQSLPISYFDTHKTGDVMSVYTNDTDALRQLVSQSLPSLLISSISIISLLCIMLSFSIWLSLVIFTGVAVMFVITKVIGGNSAKYFVKQQISLGAEEGYIQEMIQGQKVVKVFNHEEEANKKFDVKNEQLCDDATKAHGFANILMPIMNNLSYLHYALTAIVGASLVIMSGQREMGIFTVGIGSLVAFLQYTRSFSQPLTQVSQQFNVIINALAGAERIFNLLDEEPEVDEGYVTLVNAEIDADGNIKETDKRTGKWAWKHPHHDGTLTYTEVKGMVEFEDVEFGYDKEKIVLNGVSLYAKPEQKIAFVGSTGAGKKTITNLINRFYDVPDGKIRYDGININKIKKADLRKSLSMVLQDTHLFTGTVMENIRYGKLDATDEEVYAAAKLANAHWFITHLPQGYDTVLKGDGSNLSQGQRQLLAIARAAVADTPVLILDEATSSIDTRTEALIEKGMDRLMEGRTVFVIAHRLSTVKNSHAIMVLENGKIIERGDHEQLLAQKGRYYQLYTGMFELS